jgi:hypothetical protein
MGIFRWPFSANTRCKYFVLVRTIARDYCGSWQKRQNYVFRATAGE